MALTAIQQLELMNGDLKPPSVDLGVLVHQTAFIYSKNFYDDLVDTTGNALAESYKNKMIGVAKRVFRNESGIVAILHRMIATIIGDSAFTYAQVSAADDSAWQGFVLNNMDEAFEYIADVRADEKSAYNAV